MSDQAVLLAEGLNKSYQDPNGSIAILKNFFLRIEKGEHLAIMGASGSGKTTLLQLLGGLDTPDSGKVLLNSQNLFSLNSHQLSHVRNKYLGFVYQFHHLLPEFSAIENVAMPALIAGFNKKIACAKAQELLERVGLKNRLNHKPSALSGGERQRVAIARALVLRPVLVLADEPTGNLDPNTAADVYNLMREIHREHQTSFIMVTHDQQLADKMDRVITLD